jgi:alginate O-acetyltransferase complex protein AlgI
MIFSSIAFLFYFLPIALVLYYFPGNRFRNATLLAVSLIAYAWSEQSHLLLLVFTIFLNYGLGLLFLAVEAKADGQGRAEQTNGPHIPGLSRDKRRKWLLAAGVAANLGILVFYKYSGWLLSWLVPSCIPVASEISSVGNFRAPLGISFFTFHALSYLVDVYRGDAQVQRNLLNYGLYISVFPKMLAGPIQPYHEAPAQLERRTVDPELFLTGTTRFIHGLAKKALLANPLAGFADRVFAIPPEMLSTELAWLGLASYTLQIYFDFSGYTDMAIGLGQMFGFRFPENFDHPYISRSIREFWRRWHISLSNWFRDYLYIPLGGNRCSPAKQYANLVMVFFLCGLWHGASWNFVIWGLWHGAFLVLERTALGGRVLNRLGSPLRHLYALLAVALGWVFFRCETLGHSVSFLASLFGMGAGGDAALPTGLYVNAEWILCMGIGTLGSMPLMTRLEKILGRTEWRGVTGQGSRGGLSLLKGLAWSGLLVLSCMALAGTTHNPFIYFRF